MAEPDAFDPTRALDGWRAPALASVPELALDTPLQRGTREEAASLLVRTDSASFDPTHLLDGWRPPAPAPLDLDLKSLLRGGTGPDPAKLARLKARGYEMLDVEDVELVEAPPPLRVAVEARVREIPPAPAPTEADPAPQPLSGGAAKADDAVDVPLPAEEVWPLFMEEAQILDAGAASAADIEIPVPEPQPWIEPEPGPLSTSGLRDVERELEADEVGPASETPAAVAMAETPAAEPEVEPAPPVMAEASEVTTTVVDVIAPELEAPVAAVEMPPEPEVEPEVEAAPSMLAVAAEATVTLELPEVEPETRIPVELLGAEAKIELMPSSEAEQPPAMVAQALAVDVQAVESELASLAMDDQRVPEADDFVAERGVPAPPIEPPALDFRAFPSPTPRFIDDIQLPCVPPPPAVFEAPVLDFRVVPPPPEPDPESVIAGIELPRVTPPPTVVEMPELDISALAPQLPARDPRLLEQWQAGAWTALARRVAGASQELLQTPQGLRVESHAPQWLCAIWPPQAEDTPLGRWPELASLVSAETMADALQQLLGELPGEAPLWSADLEVDWDLVAELVLHQDALLRQAQARALRELAEAERRKRLAMFSDAYTLQGRVARRRA